MAVSSSLSCSLAQEGVCEGLGTRVYSLGRSTREGEPSCVLISNFIGAEEACTDLPWTPCKA